jgi:hypothetical protein
LELLARTRTSRADVKLEVEESSTPVHLWFFATRLMVSTLFGMSLKQIQREIGATGKTAWRMSCQIRSLLSEDLHPEGPTVETDEAYRTASRGGAALGRF